jgi:hypothetical protein
MSCINFEYNLFNNNTGQQIFSFCLQYGRSKRFCLYTKSLMLITEMTVKICNSHSFLLLACFQKIKVGLSNHQSVCLCVPH